MSSDDSITNTSDLNESYVQMEHPGANNNNNNIEQSMKTSAEMEGFGDLRSIHLDSMQQNGDIVSLINCIVELSKLNLNALKFSYVILINDFKSLVEKDPDLNSPTEFAELLNTKCTRNCLKHLMLFHLRKGGDRQFKPEEFEEKFRLNFINIDKQIQEEMNHWDEYKTAIDKNKFDKREGLRARPYMYKLVNSIDSIGRDVSIGLLGFYGSRIRSIINEMPQNVSYDYLRSTPALSLFECQIIRLFCETHPSQHRWLGALINNIVETVFLFKYSVKKAAPLDAL